MGRPKRNGEYRDTTVRVTPDYDNNIASIRALAHKFGGPICNSQSEAVMYAVRYTSQVLYAAYEAAKGLKDEH